MLSLSALSTNLQAKSIVGGYGGYDSFQNCTSADTCLLGQNSNCGCTTGPDETMTCMNWGCPH
ncbi:hypothetical protein [Seonamhaeicola sp. S2-3]|uniref:hypothetical protein n=1 Tax=Seonamhaeicola sp. S2-3 TaxID=1936081 RepID=UPI0012F7EA12|nr:hypothetical protein [Seonamhaeicola sp. S2-3]